MSSGFNSSPFKPGSAHVMSVSAVNAYTQSMTIKARCTEKSTMRNFKNGNGKLFSCVLVDSTGDVKATAFNEDADRLYPLLEDNKIYQLSKFRAKPADQRYNKTSHSYEITFSRDTEIKELDDKDDISVPKATFSFIENLSSLNDIQEKEFVDVAGALLECGEVSSFTSKANNELTKRELVLVDPSQYKIRLTLWNDDARNFTEDGSGTTIIAIKKAKVSDFNGKSLSASMSSTILKNDFSNPKIVKLRDWFVNGGKNESFMDFDKENNPINDDGRAIKRQKREDFLFLEAANSMPIEEKVLYIHIGILVYIGWDCY